MDSGRKDATMTIDGCNQAIVGHFTRCGQPAVVVYDYSRLLRCFEKQGMTFEEAQEWVSFNIEGAWVGAGTPAVMYRGNHAAVMEAVGMP